MTSLSASGFRGSRREVVITEFHKVLELFSVSSKQMCDSDTSLSLRRHEDVIRNVFIAKFVRKNKQQFALGYLNFDAETAEIDPDNFESKSYVDIKVTNLKGQGENVDENFCYSFECKRIKSASKAELISEYINEGIVRFINGKYSLVMPIAGMIGFVEASNVNLATLTENINAGLQENWKKNTSKYLAEYYEVKLEDQCYFSVHSREKGLGLIQLVHMFLWVNKN